MHKKLLTTAMVISMTAMMSITAMAAGWQQNATGWWWQNDDGTWPANTWVWLDGNRDGIAECYYFDGNGYMAANTTTPDGYMVDANGAWTVNGAVQVQQITQNNEQSTSTERYAYIGGPGYVANDGTLHGSYNESEEVYNSLKASAVGMHFFDKLNPEHEIYERNGDKLTLGWETPVGIAYVGQWMIDNTKPEAQYGVTNIRYQYPDGTFAGYGWHGGRFDDEYTMWRINNYGVGTQEYTKNNYFFTEDGYLVRNAIITSDYRIYPYMVGMDGGWLDRSEY